MKNQIIGVWRNKDGEYIFNEDNSMNILWKKNNTESKGVYSIDGKVITFNYGWNNNETWQGEIQSISNSTLSIIDLTEEIDKVDTFQRVFPILTNEKKLSNYIFENIFLVFLFILFYEWISNLGKQVDNIFNTYPGEFSYYLLIGVIGLIAIILFILSVNSVITIALFGFEESIKKINKPNLKLFLLNSPILFFNFSLNKFENEKENKFYIPFWVFSGILIFYISGSPIINNYTGVYVSFEQLYQGTHGSPDGTEAKEIPSYVYNKQDKYLVEQKIKKTINAILDTEDDGYEDYEKFQYEDLEFDVYSRGYLFEQTAIIEGYESNNNSYNGFLDYVSALFYFSLEKLIITLIWVLIPFLTWVGIASYRNKS
jgi:hypothetical protein